MLKTSSKQPSTERGVTGALLAVGAVVLCCAGPALVAGGVITAVGGVFSSPVVIALGVALVAGALCFALWRSRRGDRACDPPRTVIAESERSEP